MQNAGKGSPKAAPGETQIDRSGKNESKDENKSQNPGAKDSMQLAKAESKKESEKSAAAKKAADKKAQAKKGSGKNGKGSKAAKGTQPGKGGNPAKGGQPGEKRGSNNKPGENEPGENKPEEQKEAEPSEKPESLDELAEKQSELSKEAAELAEKLERLAGKDSRLGHGVPGKMRTAASNMQKATDSLGHGDTENAGTQGAQAGAALESTIAMLEKIIDGRADRVDVSKEDAPKKYESVISEYFKALSYDK